MPIFALLEEVEPNGLYIALRSLTINKIYVRMIPRSIRIESMRAKFGRGPTDKGTLQLYIVDSTSRDTSQKALLLDTVINKNMS